MLRRFLDRRRAARERVLKDAIKLLTWMGEPAYDEARTRAREADGRRDGAGGRHWSRVAVEIADRTGKVVGEKVADRYAADLEPEKLQPNHRALIEGLTEIADGIAALARGRETPTTLHNAEAAVHRMTALAREPNADAAGRDLCRAIRDLASTPAESASAVAADVYPPRAETAGKALQRFRAAVLPGRLA